MARPTLFSELRRHVAGLPANRAHTRVTAAPSAKAGRRSTRARTKAPRAAFTAEPSVKEPGSKLREDVLPGVSSAILWWQRRAANAGSPPASICTTPASDAADPVAVLGCQRLAAQTHVRSRASYLPRHMATSDCNARLCSIKLLLMFRTGRLHESERGNGSRLCRHSP